MIPTKSVTDFKYSLMLKILTGGLFVIQISLLFIDRMPGLFNYWDGLEYHNIALYFQQDSYKENIGSYYVQRIFVSFLLFLFSYATNTEISEINTVIFYSLWNIFCTSISLFCYLRISEKYMLSPATKVFGFAGIFYSFFTLKMSSFYPVLLDQTAFMLGFVLLYSLLYNKIILSYFTIFLGAFTFPTILPSGLLLTVLSDKKYKKYFLSVQSHTVKYTRIIAGPLKILVPFFSSLLYLYLIYFFFESKENAVYKFANEKIINLDEYWPSAMLSASAIFIFVYNIISLIVRKNINQIISFIHIAVSILLFLSVKLIYYSISNQKISLGFLWFPINLIKQSIQFPLVSIASHINYYGPLIILSIIFHKEILELVVKKGLGWFLFFVINFGFMLLGSESRQFVFFIPFCSVIVLKLLNQKISETFQFQKLIFHIIICLLFSKFWWIINVSGFAEKIKYLYLTSDFDNSIIQRYFIFQGPWLNFDSYTIIAYSATGLFFLYYFLFRSSSECKEISKNS